MELYNSLQMSISGEIKQINCDKPTFRKYINTQSRGSLIELKIAESIFSSPLQNVVKVYDICCCTIQNDFHGEIYYIDYELLNTDIIPVLKNERKKFFSHIRNGIQELHNRNIVYIDFKYNVGDNTGFSKIDNEWKLYDFDACGITDNTNMIWEYEPDDLYNYRHVKKIIARSKKYRNCKLTKIDEILFRWIHNVEL